MELVWQLKNTRDDIALHLQESLKISPVLCRLLDQREITTFDEAKKFFRPTKENLHSPWQMKDMDKAVARIEKAMQTDEKIMLFGDYDVDGTTAVATVYLFLKKIYPRVSFYIPNRYKEGYGISKLGIDFAKTEGIGLIISLDCGIKSVELIAYANTIGIDFIICDHHLPDAELPPATAILNAKQTDCNYPYKELCGCGVGLKLITAIAEKHGIEEALVFENIDLVAVAIASDIVPITGENRLLAQIGLEKLNTNPNKGLKALSGLGGADRLSTLKIVNLVFIIAPRINAAGRMDDAKKAVEMLIADTDETALNHAKTLHTDNIERKDTDKEITQEALALIDNNPAWKSRRSLVLYQPHWHKGVIGIVASRVIENYYKPTIVLTKSGEYYTGSARSVVGFNLYEAIHACRDLLIGYGGHFAAAGLTLKAANLEAFREKFEQAVAESIQPQSLYPKLLIDLEIDFKNITPSLLNIINQMEPFGPENMQPLFITRHVQDTGQSRIVKEDHVKFSLAQGKEIMQGIGFGLAKKFDLLHDRQPIDIVYKIEENEWNNQKTIQLKIEDIKKSEII